jgi:hypothetical protein
LTCGRNYRKERDEVSGEYECIPNECENRTPWRNKSCSLKEDFLPFDENSKSIKSECYYLKYIYDDKEKTKNDDKEENDNNNFYNIFNNNIYIDNDYDEYDDDDNYDRKGRCVKKEECPLDYPGVCNYFFFLLNIIIIFFLIKHIILFLFFFFFLFFF